MQEFDDECQGRFIIVVKDELVVAGLDFDIAHWIVPLVSCHFDWSPNIGETRTYRERCHVSKNVRDSSNQI
jgi:hypothetical protein